LSRGRFEQLPERSASAEKARTHGVDRQMKKIGNLRIAELLEFTQEEDFPVDGLELGDGVANPKASFGRIVSGGVGNGFRLTEQGRSEDNLSAMRSQNFQRNGVQVGTKQRSRLVAVCGPE
jgi:hypothetical protein